jgi:hypothetical protein
MQMTLRPLFPVALLITALALSLGSAQAYAQDDDGNRIFEGVTIESGTYQAADSITARNTTVENGNDVTFRAGKGIRLEAGFKVEAVSRFRAEIGQPEVIRCGKPVATAEPPPTSEEAAQVATIREQRAENDTVALEIQVDVINVYEDNGFNGTNGKVSRSTIDTQIDSLNEAYSSLFRFELGFVDYVADSTKYHSSWWRQNSNNEYELTPVGETVYQEETQDHERIINLLITGNLDPNGRLLGVSSIPGAYSDPTDYRHAVAVDFRTLPGTNGISSLQ